MLMKIEIDGETHEVDPAALTMGEKWMMARDFDVDWEKVEETGDIGYGGVIGLFVVALTRTGLSEARAKAQVLAMTDDQITVTPPEPDPTEAAKGGNTTTPARRTRAASGKSGT